MTTATTSTAVDHTSDAGFRTWVAEVITMLFTSLGATQTGDTGQINTTTVTRPAANTMAGYVIGRFNDTLQSTSPIFFKLQFGTGALTTGPMMELQVGTGSNGTGTLTGPLTAVTCCGIGNVSPIGPGTTAYVTRGCYNTTDGVLWLAWKLNALGTTNQCAQGFMIARSNDNTGAATGDAVGMLTNSNTNSQNTNSGFMQWVSFLTGVAYNGSPPMNSQSWCFMPYTPTVTLFSGNTQVGPVFQYTPVMGVSNWAAIAITGEIAVGSSTSLTLVGSTAHTYISVGCPFGTSNFGALSYTATGGGSTTYTLLWPWE